MSSNAQESNDLNPLCVDVMAAAALLSSRLPTLDFDSLVRLVLPSIAKSLGVEDQQAALLLFREAMRVLSETSWRLNMLATQKDMMTAFKVISDSEAEHRSKTNLL